MRTLQAVSFNVEAAHKSAGDPRLHGHSYVVELWVETIRDFGALEADLKPLRSILDHSVLNESIGGTTMEAMAEWVMAKAAHLNPARVVISRPTLGYRVELTR